MRKWYGTMITVFMIFSVVFGTAVSAQDDADVCPTLVDLALANVGNSCANMGRNSVCYGFDDVEANFIDDSELLQPADRAGLEHLASLQTMPFDAENEKWGISVLNVQANLPNTLPGEAVKMLLLGDVRIEEETAMEYRLRLPEDALEVSVMTEMADLVDTPIEFGVVQLKVVGNVAAGETLLADGVSPSGDWVRVTYEFATEYGQKATAWIHGDDLAEEITLTDLPTIGPSSYTAMQAFYFSTGIGIAECNELPPSSLLVQGPENIEVEIRANGADVRITSTVLLQTSANDDMMRLTTLSGIARVNPDTAEELLIPAGYSAVICLDGPYNLGVANNENDFVSGMECGWSLTGGMTQDDLSRLGSLENIPGNLLNYDIVIRELVCASGVGGVVCQYRYGDPGYDEALVGLCEAGLIDPEICLTVASGVVVSEEVEICQAAAEEMQGSIANNCGDLGWNQVCYGYQNMVASFAGLEELLRPADRASAQNFIIASSDGFDDVMDQWGILVMNTRADLPNSYKDGSVRSVLLGESLIENAVLNDEALVLLAEPIEVVAADDHEVYSVPDSFMSEDFYVVGTVEQGATLMAEGVTEEGNWVRVAFGYETLFGYILTAWIPSEALVENAGLEDLPVIEADSLTAMQSFYFSTSSAVPTCGAAVAEAQLAYLVMQSPPDVEIRETINGADIRINGLVLLQAFPGRGLMRLVTLSGIARVQAGTADELIIPAGYSAITCMDGPFNYGADGTQNDYVVNGRCEWHLSSPLTPGALAAFGVWAISDDLLNYPATIPEWTCDEQGCEYQDNNEAYATRLMVLCAQGYLSESVCRFVSP